jgi:hypothetical protein
MTTPTTISTSAPATPDVAKPDRSPDDTMASTRSEALRGVMGTASQVADTVSGVAGEVGARLPDAASGTRSAIDEATRLVRSGSDTSLKIGGALSIGFALGLLIGGASRLLVLAALLPAALIGSTLVERMEASERPPRSA